MMLRGTYTIILIGLLVYIAVCVMTYLRQRQLLYYPTPRPQVELIQPPGSVFKIEEMSVSSGEETLRLWRLNPGHDQAVLYYGGNSEEVLYGRELFEELFKDRTVYLTNYRGYSGSSGSPSEKGFYEDGLSVYDAITADHQSIAIIGRSIGSAVATHVAARREVERVVLVTPMDSVEALAQAVYPLLPVKWLLKDRFHSTHDATLMTSPVLVVIAADDMIVPRQNTDRLIETMGKAEVQVVVVADEDHITIATSSGYAQALRSFFNLPVLSMQ